MTRARQIRLDKGLTLLAVAEATGLSLGAVRRAEDPTCEPQAPTLKALGDFYGVPASSLVLPAIKPEEAAA